MINIIKIRFITYTLSLITIFIGFYFVFNYGIKFSTEFTGGTTITFEGDTIKKEELKNIITPFAKDTNIEIRVKDLKTATIKIPKSLDNKEVEQMQKTLKDSVKGFVLQDLIVVEPNVGKELINKTLVAIALSIIVIFLFVWKSFGDITSSTAAIIAMLHDVVILIGIFGIFSYVYGTELDLLIVTAILTLLSFSLYDTIVIFDEIRKIKKKFKAQNIQNLQETINTAVSKVFVRSINNSITSIIALFSLALFVEGQLFWFSVALLIGVILGTYSSPFIASTIYYDIQKLLLSKKKK